MVLQELFEQRGVVLRNGHFRLTTGRHSDTYVNKDRIFSDPILFKTVLSSMLSELCGDFLFDVVTGPAIAGAILASPLAVMTGKIFVYPEKVMKNPLAGNPYEWEKMKFRRGYDKVVKNNNILIVEDVITTGISVQRTIDAIEKDGGMISGVACIWNRSGWSTDLCEVKSLIHEELDSWWPEECPYCKEGVELMDPKDA